MNMYIYLTWAWSVSRTYSLGRWLVGDQLKQVKKSRRCIPQAQSWPQQCPARCHCRWRSSEPQQPGCGWPKVGASKVSIPRAVAEKSDATYLGTEVLEGKALDGVDAQLRVGLDNGETTGHCRKGKGYVSGYSRVCRKALFRYAARERGSDIRKYCLVAPPSSTISTRPGLSCSMEGTWLARTPISPEAAGMLTWVL